MDAAACIGCGACVAACRKNASASLFVGAKVSQLALLPQGHPERASRARTMVQDDGRARVRQLLERGECEAVCPKEISIASIARDAPGVHAGDRGGRRSLTRSPAVRILAASLATSS